MLNHCFQGEKLQLSSPCVLLMGGFDGLHIGHEKLIECAKEYSLPIGITAMTGAKGKSVFTLSEREKIFSAHGLQFYIPFAFTEEFQNTSKEDFLSSVIGNFNVKAFVCGQDFRFGKGAQGSPEFLHQFTGVPVHALHVFTVQGKKVSVSSVKEFLAKGDLLKANQLLLTPFFLTAKVEEGRKMGRMLGFPTANFTYPEEKFPLKEGVYAVHAEIDGIIYRGIANFGACPTFGVKYTKVEVHFDGFDGNLYGRELDVYFDFYMRDIQKFNDTQALIAQLQKDLLCIRQ